MNKKLFIVLSALVLSLFSCGKVFASEAGGIGVMPYQDVGSEQRSWFVYTDVKPGAVIKDRMLVTNSMKEDVALSLYGVDAKTTADGGYAPEADDAPRVDVGNWLNFENGELMLRAGQSKVVSFSVRVPQKVGVGDHFGTILIRRAKPAQIFEKQENGEVMKSNFQVVIRVGTRIYLTVAGTPIQKLTFEDLSFANNDGKPYFYFSLANDGNVRLNPSGSLKIYPANKTDGKPIAEFNPSLREIFPYTKTKVPFEWAKPQFGKFLAKSIVYGPKGEQYTKDLAFEWNAPKVEGAVSIFGGQQVKFFGASSDLLIVIVLLLLVILFLVKRRR